MKDKSGSDEKNKRKYPGRTCTTSIKSRQNRSAAKQNSASYRRRQGPYDDVPGELEQLSPDSKAYRRKREHCRPANSQNHKKTYGRLFYTVPEKPRQAQLD